MVQRIAAGISSTPEGLPQEPLFWDEADDGVWGQADLDADRAQLDDNNGGERMTDGDSSSGPDPYGEPDYSAQRSSEPETEMGPAVAEPGPAHDQTDDPGQPDPAALIIAWLRRGFDGLHFEFQQLSTAVAQQEAALLQLAEFQPALTQVSGAQALLSQAVESQSSEINMSLAELEGCAAQLRNEASSLHNLRAELSVGIGAMLLELREALVAELPRIISQVVEPAIRAAVVDLSTRIDEQSGAEFGDPLVALRLVTDELNERVPAIVHEAVRSALTTANAPLASPRVSEPVLPPEPFFTAPAPEAAVPEPTPPTEADSSLAGDAGVALRVAAPEVPPASLETDEAGLFVDPEVVELPEEPQPSDESTFQRPPEMPVEPSIEASAEPTPEPLVAQPLDLIAESVGVGVVEEELGGTDVTCVMPGMAVGPSLAVAVTAALERSRLRRRRLRRAGPPRAGLHRRDPYVGEVGQRLERFALARGKGAFEPRDPQALPELRVAAGEYGGHEFAIDLGVLGCLCLVGTQPAGVASALAVSLLSQPARAQAEVIAIGDILPVAPSVPGLTRADSSRVALDRLEVEVAERATRLADDGAETVAAYNARHPAEPITPLLVVTARPADADGLRLRTLVTDGAHCGVAAVVVDAELDGAPTLRLKGGGVVEGLHPETTLGGLIGARLFLLSFDSIAQILGVLAAARTDVEYPSVAGDEPFVVVDPPGEVPIQVQLLGPYRIDAAGKEIRSGLRAKARELLAFYLLHPEGATLDTATEALWPEADSGRGSEWFWTALGNLRSLLRSTTGIKELKVIEREGEVYKVEPIFDVDLWRLQQVLDEASTNGDRAGNDVGADELWAECLQRAAELYSGELLEGADWAWARVPREDVRSRAVDVLISLSATRLVTDDVRGALEVLQRAVDVDPYSEQLYRRIMRLQAKLSRPDAVAATFRQLATRLAEVGFEPAAESERLAQELSAGADAPG